MGASASFTELSGLRCIKGDEWKLMAYVLDELRAKKYPGLLSR